MSLFFEIPVPWHIRLVLNSPGAIGPFTSRGNARQDIVREDRDRTQLLTLLAHVVDL